MQQEEVLYEVNAHSESWMIAGRKRGHVSLPINQGLEITFVNKYGASTPHWKITFGSFNVRPVPYLWYLIHLLHYGRFKDSYLNIMCAASGGICSSSSTWAAKCQRGKYKLQSCWSAPGLHFAPNSQLLLLHSSLIGRVITISSISFAYFFSIRKIVIGTIFNYHEICMCFLFFNSKKLLFIWGWAVLRVSQNHHLRCNTLAHV